MNSATEEQSYFSMSYTLKMMAYRLQLGSLLMRLDPISGTYPLITIVLWTTRLWPFFSYKDL